jgi:hypothetical protein
MVGTKEVGVAPGEEGQCFWTLLACGFHAQGLGLWRDKV